MTRCNCGASCGENRYHERGSVGCIYRVEDRVEVVPIIKSERDFLREFNKKMTALLEKVVDHTLKDPLNQSLLYENALEAKKILVEQEIFRASRPG